MEYRQTSPADNGFESEHEQESELHQQIQYRMSHTTPDELLDSLLITCNIAEQRALLYQNDPMLGDWYDTLSVCLRETLDHMTRKDGPRPQEMLENPVLYFPETEHRH